MSIYAINTCIYMYTFNIGGIRKNCFISEPHIYTCSTIVCICMLIYHFEFSSDRPPKIIKIFVLWPNN